MKKKENTIKNKTSKRGRPPKSFVSRKPQIKRDGPGRPKKHEKIEFPQIPERKENRIKDAIIWALFIISFLIFGFSIYISQKEKISSLLAQNKESQQESIIEQEEKQEKITQQEPIINDVTTTGQEIISIEPIPVPQDKKFVILQNIYLAINESRFDDFYTYIDNSLKQSSVFKTYFSKNRLQRFIDNIDNQNINIELINIDNEIQKVGYKLNYSINNIVFIEEREVTFTERDDGQKISKIMCITKGCSTMPFFNPGKYF